MRNDNLINCGAGRFHSASLAMTRLGPRQTSGTVAVPYATSMVGNFAIAFAFALMVTSP